MTGAEFISYIEEGGTLYTGPSRLLVGVWPESGIQLFDFQMLTADQKERFAQLWRDGKLHFRDDGNKNPGFQVLPFFLRIGPFRG